MTEVVQKLWQDDRRTIEVKRRVEILMDALGESDKLHNKVLLTLLETGDDNAYEISSKYEAPINAVPYITHELDFGLHDTVHVDGDKTISMIVIAFCWRGAGIQVELSWFASGSHHSHWFDADRCKLSED